MTDKDPITPPNEMKEPQAINEYFDALHEHYNAICAAHNALRSMAGIIETSLNETDDYRSEDLSGDIYCIRSALQSYERLIKASGLKGDGIRWRI